MDQQEESGQYGQATEFMRTLERQFAGLDRHFRGSDGFGWFEQDPRSIAPGMLQKGRFKIKTVGDLSNVETFVEGKKHKLAFGSFSIEMDSGRAGLGMGLFIFSHPEDIAEFLQKAAVEHPKELLGKEMVLFWIGRNREPLAGDRTVGIDLLGYSVPLSEFTNRDRTR